MKFQSEPRGFAAFATLLLLLVVFLFPTSAMAQKGPEVIVKIGAGAISFEPNVDQSMMSALMEGATNAPQAAAKPSRKTPGQMSIG